MTHAHVKQMEGTFAVDASPDLSNELPMGSDISLPLHQCSEEEIFRASKVNLLVADLDGPAPGINGYTPAS